MAQKNLVTYFSLFMYLPHLHERNLYNDNKLLFFFYNRFDGNQSGNILTNKDRMYIEGVDEFKEIVEKW